MTSCNAVDEYLNYQLRSNAKTVKALNGSKFRKYNTTTYCNQNIENFLSNTLTYRAASFMTSCNAVDEYLNYQLRSNAKTVKALNGNEFLKFIECS